jgi:cytochrome b involved in lipid metabolism
LVILDDLVLDVTDYMDNHPGGKFLLQHNIGRDISKFFYGGYALDGNMVGADKRNTHSNIARLQIETLIIARLLPNPSQFISNHMA